MRTEIQVGILGDSIKRSDMWKGVLEGEDKNWDQKKKKSEEIIAKSKLDERQKCTKSSWVKFKQNELKEKHA